MDHLPEVVQSVSAFVGVLTAAISAVVVRSRLKTARELKQIDVSVEWQSQMLARITAVEAELQRERVRGDLLEQEGFQWRKQASDLEWELKAAKAQREELRDAVQELRAENGHLIKQNAVLAGELRELYKQVRGGHQGLSLPPATGTTQRKIKLDDR